jgi:ribonuclease PH
VALAQALQKLVADDVVTSLPMTGLVAAISVGVVEGEPLLDIDYVEDSSAEVDFNVVMNDAGELVEVQGTAEGRAFEREMMDRLIDMAADGIRALHAEQRAALAAVGVALS